MALIVILAKVFIFDTIPKDEELNKTVEVPSEQASLVDNSYHKYEKKTKTLEIEYVEEEKKFTFFDDKTNVETQTIPEVKRETETLKSKKETEKEKKLVTEKVSKEQYSKIEEETKKQSTTQIGSGSAKLVIIIDDITTKKHIHKIQEIGYNITMALMPPTEIHKDSASIAQSLNSYMVHLPLEATSRSAEESNTLHVGDDLAVIEKRIKQLKILYPKALYYNNHTGSKFTADEQSMDMLIQVLKNNNIQFVDSRTTPKSVAKQYATKYGMRYIGRNIFLDNIPTKNAIKIQLQKAIEIAKNWKCNSHWSSL